LSDPIPTRNGVRQDGNEVAQFVPCNMSKHEMLYYMTMHFCMCVVLSPWNAYAGEMKIWD